MNDEEPKSDQLDQLLVDKVKESLRKTYDARVGKAVPDFEATWFAAKDRVRVSKRRSKMNSAIAASIALVAIVFTAMLSQQSSQRPDSELAAMLLVSTQWIAPSDVLMPEHSFDIYRDVPEFIEPIDLTKGLLL